MRRRSWRGYATRPNRCAAPLPLSRTSRTQRAQQYACHCPPPSRHCEHPLALAGVVHTVADPPSIDILSCRCAPSATHVSQRHASLLTASPATTAQNSSLRPVCRAQRATSAPSLAGTLGPFSSCLLVAHPAERAGASTHMQSRYRRNCTAASHKKKANTRAQRAVPGENWECGGRGSESST